MPKYYYTCPIKALYMMKEFGVKFELGYGAFRNYKIEDNSIHSIREFINDCLDYGQDFRKFCVSEESEHIFEPKEGDVGLLDNRHSAIFQGGSWRYDEMISDSKPYFEKEHRGKIIMRDNKQFFMPKEENGK